MRINHLNNFDFLRLLFASLVIVTHSYPLSGQPEHDLLFQLTGGQSLFSYIAVRGFFIISGFLIFQSVIRSKTPGEYFRKRALRLFPGLLGVLLITVLLAPFVYHYDKSYLLNGDVYRYVLNNLSLLFTDYSISGVFENNPYPKAINGSLWTILYEASLYVALAGFFLFKKRYLKTGLWLGFLLSLFFNYSHFDFHVGEFVARLAYELAVFFFAGSLLAAYNFQETKHLKKIVAAFSILLIICFAFHLFPYAKWFILPPLVISFGACSFPYINRAGKPMGDISYGIYLYAFPVQQTLEYFFHFGTSALMLSSFFITVLFAYASWHCIEKPAKEIFKPKKVAANKPAFKVINVKEHVKD